MATNDDDRDGRSSVARGYVLANRVTSIAMQMAIPPAIGWWADTKLNTGPWLLILGAGLGLTISLYELVRLGNESNKGKS